MILHLEILDVGDAAFLLARDILLQRRGSHLLVVVDGDEEVSRLKWYHGVELASFFDFFAPVLKVANDIVFDAPAVEGIPLDALGSEARHEPFVAVKEVEREAHAALGVGVITAHICYLSGGHHKHDVRAIIHAFVLDIGVAVIDALDIGGRYDVSAEQECCGSDDTRRNHVRAQQSPEAHAGGEHGNNLGVAG